MVVQLLSKYYELGIIIAFYFQTGTCRQERNKNISDLCTNMLNMGFIFLASIPTALTMVYFCSEELLSGFGEWCLYFGHFGITFVVAIIFPSTYYARNPGLRQGVLRRIRESELVSSWECPTKARRPFQTVQRSDDIALEVMPMRAADI